jgi:hypothetical protein
LSIDSGHQLRHRLKKAVANLFFVKVEPNMKYKQDALKHLCQAKAGINKELAYFTSQYSNSSSFTAIICRTSDSALLRQLDARMKLLAAYLEAIKQLATTLAEKSGLSAEENSDIKKQNDNRGVALRCRVPDNLTELMSNSCNSSELSSWMLEICAILALTFFMR